MLDFLALPGLFVGQKCQEKFKENGSLCKVSYVLRALSQSHSTYMLVNLCASKETFRDFKRLYITGNKIRSIFIEEEKNIIHVNSKNFREGH